MDDDMQRAWLEQVIEEFRGEPYRSEKVLEDVGLNVFYMEKGSAYVGQGCRQPENYYLTVDSAYQTALVEKLDELNREYGLFFKVFNDDDYGVVIVMGCERTFPPHVMAQVIQYAYGRICNIPYVPDDVEFLERLTDSL